MDGYIIISSYICLLSIALHFLGLMVKQKNVRILVVLYMALISSQPPSPKICQTKT